MNLTVLAYCHPKHSIWISHFIEQLNQQTFQDFKIIFIAHNFNLRGDEFKNLKNKNLTLKSYFSDPIIGRVINEGLKFVHTPYVAHFDVDDIFHPRRFELQMEFLKERPEIDFLGTRMVGFYGEPKEEMLSLDYYEPNEPNATIQTHEEIYDCIVRRGQNCLGHSTMIYKPEVMKRLGGFSLSDVKTDGHSPDMMSWRKALIAGKKFHRLPQLCALWRLDSSSIRV